jgi:hypothetical protein
MTDLVSQLVEQGSRDVEYKKKLEERAQKSKKSQMWKDMASLTDKAPKFDGTEDVHYWLTSMQKYFRRCDVTEPHVKREVLIGALTGVA